MVRSRAASMRGMCFQLQSSLDADIVLDISVTSRTERGVLLRGALLTAHAFSANSSLSLPLLATVCGMVSVVSFFILQFP